MTVMPITIVVLLMLQSASSSATTADTNVPNKNPTAEVTAPPRTLQSLNYPRAPTQDSSITREGATGTGATQQVSYSRCEIAPRASGCP